SGGEDGVVERVDEGRHETKARDDLACERGLEGERCGQRAAHAPVARAKKIGCGMLGTEALGDAGERFGVDGLHGGSARGARLQEFGELRAVLAMVPGYPAAKGEELIALGHVDPGGEEKVFGSDLNVEAAARGLLHAAP